MLADTIFTDQKQVAIAPGVAIQAQPLDGEVCLRHVQRLAPLMLAIEPEQHGLLTLAVERGDQQALLAGTMIQPLEAAFERTEWRTLGVQQLHAARIRPNQQLRSARPELIGADQLGTFSFQRCGGRGAQVQCGLVGSWLTGSGLTGGQRNAKAQPQGFKRSYVHGFSIQQPLTGTGPKGNGAVPGRRKSEVGKGRDQKCVRVRPSL